MLTTKDHLIIFDTDPGTDDAIALFLLSSYRDSEDLVCVSSFGNMPLSVTNANLVKLIDYFGTNCEIVKGSKNSLSKVSPDCGGYHGSDGLGDVCFPSGNLTIKCEEWDTPESEDSFVPKVNDLIEQSPNGCTYIAVGPLTNLAKLILSNPRIANPIDKVLIMGGGFSEFNMPNNTEYNFYCDSKAVDIVLSSDLDLTIFPLDFTMINYLSEDEIDKLKNHAPRNKVVDILKANYLSARRHGIEGAVIHDAFPVLYNFFEDAFTLETKKISCDEHGGIFEDEKGKSVEVAVSVREDLLFQSLLETLGKFEQVRDGDLK